jgi:synaptobrevin family protein YKT6
MSFTAKTIAERTSPGSRQDVEEQRASSTMVSYSDAADRRLSEYTFHSYARTEGVCGLIITDLEYPALVAHQLLSKICDEFLSKYPRTAFATATTLQFPELKEYIVKYQDPQQADSIMKIQKELDETKIVLHKTIESVLERGEKIDNLVAKSDGLSMQSKMFYTQVRSQMWDFLMIHLLTAILRPRNRTLAALSCKDSLAFPSLLFGVHLRVHSLRRAT